MAINRQLSKLISIDSSGVNTATFVEIKSALIERYKEIYGSDIDLSTGNADGEFVNELALIINNILQTVKLLYGNLDVNTAAGISLDALCNLSNVHRKAATQSVASVELKNESDSDIQINSIDLTLQDKSGMIWNYNDIVQTTLNIPARQSLTVQVKCSEFGAVTAPAGWIDMIVGEPNISVVQSSAAIVGSNTETDTELRSRRNRFISPIGTTVIQSLSAALLDIAGVKDVKVYNNSTDEPVVQSLDGTETLPHSIYVIIRQTSNLIDIDAVIGDTIYQKLTPGIRTTPSAVVADNKSKVFNQLDVFNETVYWKRTTGINPTITLKYTEVQNTGYSPKTSEIMANSLIEYINSLPIGDTINANEILVEMLSSDLREKGLSTINVSYSDIVSGLQNVTTNPDTFYQYSTYSETVENLVHTIKLE